VVTTPESERAIDLLPKQRQVDLQSREEHQQQHAHFREELHHRMLRRKDVEHVRSEEHAAQQQANRLGQVGAARQARDDDDQEHAYRELSQDRQNRDRLVQVLDEPHAGLSEANYFGNMNCTWARICQFGPSSGVTTL
jgi:hypothetical protein